LPFRATILAVPNPLWPAIRPTTLVLALVVSAAWPLSGHPVAAAPVGILAIGLVLARDRLGDRGRRVRGEWPPAILIVVASTLVIAGLSAAKSHRSPAPAKQAQRADAALATKPPPGAITPGSSAAHDADTAGTLASPSADAPAASPTPAAETPASPLPDTPASPLEDEATAFVGDYYTALDERRFDDAWASLSGSVRDAFGGFARWKAGYARTVSSRPRDLAVRTDGDDTIVEHRLLARDKGCDSTRNFSVTWRLERVSDTWKVAGLRGTALPGPRCK
jgi:hypothetical protein